MRHISIISKFLTLLAAVGLFVLGATAYSGYQMLRIDGSYRSLLAGEDTAAINLARANRALQTARASIGDLLMSRSVSENGAALAEVDGARAGFIKFSDAAIHALQHDADLQSLKVKGLRLLDETCKPTIDLASRATAPQDVLASQQRFLAECQPQFPAFSKAAVDVVQRLVEKVASENVTINAASHSTVWITALSIVIGLALFLMSGLLGIRKWLATPIRGLSETMRRPADADFAAIVGDTDRKDEVGGMARAVQIFKDNGLRAIEIEREANDHRGHTEEERRRNAQIEQQRIEEMTRAAEGLACGLQHLAQGDLKFTLDAPFAMDFEGLRTDFNTAVAQLADTLAAVAQSTSSIDAGSREISCSSDDLSKRTEQQAASLEETAAALDQITANVTNASRRTEEARAVAAEAEQSAEHSAQVVARAVDAIEKIEGSSRQISSIIGVIDDIAFQTNLLALNAGVEAARAGEAGKGFAVVAQEVRELAQRSARAAKEIKDLICTSEAEVDSGVALVRETGGALATIQRFVADINEHMDAIATSAREQSVGLTQVNTAVNEMDQVTQKNAAMVEETNAASATLAIESGRLRSLVAAFSLPGNGSVAPDQDEPQTRNVSTLRAVAKRGSSASAAVR